MNICLLCCKINSKQYLRIETQLVPEFKGMRDRQTDIVEKWETVWDIVWIEHARIDVYGFHFGVYCPYCNIDLIDIVTLATIISYGAIRFVSFWFSTQTCWRNMFWSRKFVGNKTKSAFFLYFNLICIRSYRTGEFMMQSVN